jgi:5-methyltetrahydrofolate--homocysteine methyltransferase
MILGVQNNSKQLIEALKTRILVIDGAMGTAIQDKNLTAADFGGPELEGCNENLVLTRPDIIQSIHEAYLAAGCDIVETNTFGSTPMVLDEFSLGKHHHTINVAAAQLARAACDKYSTPEKPRFVAGSIGPTTKAMSVTGGVTFEELTDQFRLQVLGLLEGGVDYLLIETCQDTRNIKACFIGCETAMREAGVEVPMALSVTIEAMGTMLAGQSIESLLASVAHKNLLYLGLNCATGPEFMTDFIRSLAESSPFPVACVPNAGLPDENGCYLETPPMVAGVLSRFLDRGWLNVVGGCCGTHAGHIKALTELVAGKPPHVPHPPQRSFVSGIDFLEITDEMRPLIVGERTNVIGSRKFKKLICEEKFDEASDIARAQIKSGASILDVCLANPDRDEMTDMRKFLELAVKKVRVPLMIDSTDEKVIAMALTYSQGKALINSINLEDGEERFEKVLPLAKEFGAALVVGTIDEDPIQGMGVTRHRKLEIADRSYQLLTEKYGIAPEDIYWDPLVFPCATGDKQYVGSAIETIEGIRLIKTKYPRTKAVLGISNVSFGLPEAGREVLNSIFLYHCVQAGLDLAIVNSEKLERYASIPDEEKKLAEDLLHNRGDDPVGAFANHFRVKKPTARDSGVVLPLMERLPQYIIEGSKDGLVPDLDEALKTMRPLDVINGPLMKGMDEVGRLFNTNQLIVAEVLQSAEAMKAAVAHLENFMEKNESSSRGKVILATVKGDVHDIGKNLVEIILSNNGFNVVNLGIKVPPEILIQAIREHKPDIVGLSGLLVKSAQQMVITAGDLSQAGVTPPMLVGGAALTQNFVDKQISKAYAGSVAYASDAMTGLELAKTIVNVESFEKLKAEMATRRAALAEVNAAPKIEVPEPQVRSATVPISETIPPAPDYDRHVIKHAPIDTIWNFMNPMMVYGRHLGLPGKIVRELEARTASASALRQWEQEDPKSFSIYQAVEQAKDEFRGTEVMDPSAVYAFFKAASDGNRLHLLSKDGTTTTLELPRQKKENGLCLADYVKPVPVAGTIPKWDQVEDNIGSFVVSVGRGVREIAESLKNRGEYLKSHIVQVIALESAEGYAELLHSQIRSQWGYPDSPETTMVDRFQAKYRGKRYSFGYPACPRLDDQSVLFDLLKPGEIGVQLTEGFMMDPEASVSALAFHHPNASYFSVGVRDHES